MYNQITEEGYINAQTLRGGCAALYNRIMFLCRQKPDCFIYFVIEVLRFNIFVYPEILEDESTFRVKSKL